MLITAIPWSLPSFTHRSSYVDQARLRTRTEELLEALLLDSHQGWSSPTQIDFIKIFSRANALRFRGLGWPIVLCSCQVETNECVSGILRFGSHTGCSFWHLRLLI